VRGVTERSHIGPDLTHVGSRLSLAADSVRNTMDAAADWIAHPARFKPEAQMPAFEMLGASDIASIAAYLSSLK
jgi:cytochrome c oxidase subunit 2